MHADHACKRQEDATGDNCTIAPGWSWTIPAAGMPGWAWRRITSVPVRNMMWPLHAIQPWLEEQRRVEKTRMVQERTKNKVQLRCTMPMHN